MVRTVEFNNGAICLRGEYDDETETLEIVQGSLHDFGWIWGGGAEMPGLFIVRIWNSSLWDEFAEWIDAEGISWDAVARLVENDPESVYGLTGDNVLWRFGEGLDWYVESVLEYYEDCNFVKGDRKLTEDEVDELFTDWMPNVDIDGLYNEFKDYAQKLIAFDWPFTRYDFENQLSDIRSELLEELDERLFDEYERDFLKYLDENGVVLDC